MKRRKLRALGVVVALMATACGSGDGTTTTTATGGTIPEDGFREAVEPMTVTVEATNDAMTGINVHVITEGLNWTPQFASRAHHDGEGHAKLFVDGVETARIYTEWFHLAGVPAGAHEIRVDLTGNDHVPYARSGQPVSATTTIDVPEPMDSGHGHPEAHPTEEMAVSLMVMEDAVEGWNVYITPEYMTWAPEKASSAHEDGEGHAHLYVDGQKIARVYGKAYHIAELPPGTHEISVDLNGNDHGPYTVNENKVTYSVTVQVAGEVQLPDVVLSVSVEGATVTGDTSPTVPLGSLVELVVESDVMDVVHLHGYDLEAMVSSGVARLRFTADVPGVFEVELENSGKTLASITVQ